MASLFMILIGCRPFGRNTEQHDIFFGIADKIGDLKEELINFWPETKGKLHVDAWREVKHVNGYEVIIEKKEESKDNRAKLFFINLGGYKPKEFDEFHYKMIVAAPDKGDAIQQAKKTAFYKHVQFEGATSHVDDKYGIDVDDAEEINDILSQQFRELYTIRLTKVDSHIEDQMHLGYFKLDKL